MGSVAVRFKAISDWQASIWIVSLVKIPRAVPLGLRQKNPKNWQVLQDPLIKRVVLYVAQRLIVIDNEGHGFDLVALGPKLTFMVQVFC